MKIEKIKNNINNYLFDHFRLKGLLHQTNVFLIALISAFVFAFGFCCFITPNKEATGDYAFKIITGGVSGLSQNLAKIIEICGGHLSDTTIEALGYTLFNIPILTFAFFAIGKRFALFTVVNVVASSLFINYMPEWGFTQEISGSMLVMQSPISRAVFAGFTTGFSSAICFKSEISCGGIDVLTYYYSLRKSTPVGKYGVIVNSFIVTTYALLITISVPKNWYFALITILYAIVYLFTVMIVVDAINLRNKKVQLQFITDREDFAKILLAHFPHGATITKGVGAYSGNERLVIFMVVSSFEVKRVVTLARQIDKHVFISAIALRQVYGNFFIRPIH